MAPTYSQAPVLGSVAPDFDLPSTDGKRFSPATFKTMKALVVVFYCNHCPYVVAVEDRVNQLAKDYQFKGVALVAINSNDSVRYPDDSFEEMKIRVREKNLVFPYLHDESQEVAKAYGAICTPDFFVYRNDGQFKLAYAGRLDDNWKDPAQVTQRELALALDEIVAGREITSKQNPSMGCSIKWKL